MITIMNIICADSIKWFTDQPLESINNVLTGLPDMNEMGMENIEEYLNFVRNMTELILTRLKPNGYAIFIQTDRKINGQWLDKSYYITDVALKNNFKQIWHKIVLQRDVGQTNLHRPTYSHVLCYTKTGKTGAAFPDVFPVSTKLYDNATPENICIRCAEYISVVNKNKSIPDIIDPFVGRGTVGKATLLAGLTFLGIDIDQSQCDKSLEYLKNYIKDPLNSSMKELNINEKPIKKTIIKLK